MIITEEIDIDERNKNPRQGSLKGESLQVVGVTVPMKSERHRGRAPLKSEQEASDGAWFESRFPLHFSIKYYYDRRN